ncbi:YaeQ family protein [Poseidonibacter lekithochrous]|uniref:YaeQ family protein n=1 Tax=Poseidonibacter TaxID=2321187 RepID=UPI001C093B77|nr:MULTISPECIES: YaeQ family protein [Poseidonibacter]MBU3013171.1 YaeQ family protein [Poseidonibacter lekithochrous]MDO6826467.1 YaeQ family protein [Poseidonibacter sp. 1_MG-2023]
MAANATINKALLNISNMDENYYEEHHLTIAQHPSENDLRLMIRLVAFVLNANDTLMFCKGISTDDEPDLWQKSFGDDIEMWIDLGQPDEKRIKKACGRSEKVIIYTFKESLASIWFKQIENSLFRFKNLHIIHLNIDGDIELLYNRSMKIQCNILDNELTLIDDNNSVVITQDICK